MCHLANEDNGRERTARGPVEREVKHRAFSLSSVVQLSLCSSVTRWRVPEGMS